MSDARGRDQFPGSRSAGPEKRPEATRGLINPARSQGGTRRYSDDDLVRLREIGRLLDDGLNLAGIAAVLALQAANQELQTQLDQTRQRASRPAAGRVSRGSD